MAKDKEKGNLTGFLFGNVKESGELDVEENDQVFKDLKNDLELFAKSGGQHVSFKKTLGIDEDDKNAVLDQVIVPNKDALDYEDINEQADEIQSAEFDINRQNADALARAANARILQQHQERERQRQREEEERRQREEEQRLSKLSRKERKLQKRQSRLQRKQEQAQQSQQPQSTLQPKKNYDDFDFDEDEEPTSTQRPAIQSSMTESSGDDDDDSDSSRSSRSSREDDSSSSPRSSDDSGSDSDDSDSDISDSDGGGGRSGRHYRRRRKEKKPKKKVTMKAGSYEVVKSILETPEMFTPEDQEFKVFVSGKTSDGFILKFSQLFAPKFPDKPIKRRSRRLKSQTIQPIKEESIEQDETIIWNQPSKKQPPPSSISNIRKPIVEIDSITKQLLKSGSGSGMDLDDSMISSNTTTPTLKSMSLFQQQQAEEDDEYVPEPLQETKDQEMLQIFYHVPDSNYHSLQQVDWEDNIIWDEDCLVKLKKKDNQNHLFLESQLDDSSIIIKDTTSNNNNNNNNNRSTNTVTNKPNSINSTTTNSTNTTNSKLNKPKNKNKLFGLDHDSEKEEINMEIDNQQIATTTTTTTTQPNEENNQIGGDENKLKDQQQDDNSNTKIQRWSLFPIPNQELEQGDWIDNIIWEESMVPEKLKQVSMLILDLNDRDMYFEEHIERKENNTDPIHGIAGGVSAADQPPVKKKSKKRLALEAIQAAAAAALARSQAAAAAANGQTMSFEEQLQKDKEEQERKEREEREQSQREIDKFNLSNDKYYVPVRRQVRPQNGAGKALVQHSLPGIKLSLVKTHLTKEDLIHAHRPRIQFPTYSPFRITLYNKDGNAIGSGDLNSSTNNLLANSSSSIRSSIGGVGGLNQSSSSSISNALTQPTKKSLHKSDLSGRDGRIVLIEYTEQNPPLLSNVGMGMRIRNFYKKKPHEIAPKDLGFEDGETVILDNNEESPFLGDVLPGQAVQQLVSNLYKAPLFKHQSNSNDFLLVRSRDGKRWYVRDIGPIYAAGQQLPEIEVPAPNSRSANMFLKSRLQAYIYRMFLKKSNPQRRLKIADICQAFPSQSETSIRKRLKDCADFQRGGDDSGWWTVKDNFPLPTEDELQKLVTPEVVCAYESMLVGLQRLQDNGIIHFTAPGTIPTILGSLDDEEPIKKSYRPVEEELQITPWNLTGSYLTAMQGKGRLQIISEDPTVREDEFCFLKMPQKVVNQKQKAIKQAQAKNQVTGTDADLRKLSLSASKTVLLELGVDEAIIDRLTRWQRIDLVRKKSSEAALASDSNAAMTKFARGSRYSVDHQNLQYKEQCQLVFENQMKALSGKGEDGYDEELDPDLKDLDDDLFGGTTTTTNNNPATTTQKSTGKRSRSLFRDDEDLDDENEEEALRGLFDKDPTPKLTDKEREAAEAKAKEDEEARAKAKAEADDLTRGDRIFVKRTTLFQKPDGSLFKRIEIIRDPQSVTDYQKRKPDQYQMDRKKFGKQNHDDDDETKRKKARRLEEKISKLKGSTSGSGIGYNMMNMSNNSMNTSTGSLGGGGTIGSSNIVNISAGNIQVNKSNNIRNSNDFDYNNNSGRNINNNQSSKQRISLPSNNSNSNNNFNQGGDNNGGSKSGRVRDSSNGRSDRDGHHRDSSRGDGRSERHRDSSRGEGHHRDGSRSERGDREHGSSHHRDSNRGEGHHRDGSRSDRGDRERDGHKSRNSTGSRSERDRGDRDRERSERGDGHHRNSTGNINNDNRMDISNNNNNENAPSNNNITTQPSQSGIIIRFNNSSNSVNNNNKQSQSQQQQQNIINVDDITNTPLSTASTGSTNNNRKKRTLEQSNSESPSLAGNSSTDEKSRRNRVRKDGSGADVELSNIFEIVLDKLRNTEEFVAFRVKVTSKLAPDYSKVIKNPIDLTTMRDRNRHPNWEYKSKTQFLEAIKLMVDNCYAYNQSRYINLLPIADRMMAAAISHLAPYDIAIAELEKSIEQTSLKQSSSSLLSSSTNNHNHIVSSGGEILQPLQLQSTNSNNGSSTPATPIVAQNTPTLSTNSPFFPPVDQQPRAHHSAEDEEIDILSLYESGVSPSVKNNQ